MNRKMDNINVCVRCGMLFESFYGRTACPSCSLVEDQQFVLVRRFIRENKEATIQTIVEACGVKPILLIEWIKDERIELTEESGSTIACEQCGRQIRKGKFCEACKKNLIDELNTIYKEIESDNPSSRRTRSISTRVARDLKVEKQARHGLRFKNEK